MSATRQGSSLSASRANGPSRAASATRIQRTRPSTYSAASRTGTRNTVRGGTRSFHHSPTRGYQRPPHRSLDHRYARPYHRNVRPYRGRPVPNRYGYRSYYSRWYVHPYYRGCYSTVSVVHLGFSPWPWSVAWTPQARRGWVWVAGYYNAFGFWQPGYWVPNRTAPVVYNTTYVYEQGFWQDDLYVEGYWRPDQREDGDWEWIEGYYLEDNTYVSGHWRPTAAGPEGYVWEPGFFDGESWVEGFWRPEFRAGYVWISSWYDTEGIFHTGYWEPTEPLNGQVWIPGWFDGNEWIPGYWVTETEYEGAQIEDWQPDDGWDTGWDTETGQIVTPQRSQSSSRAPLALPINIDEEPL
ncbi:MAG: hypothetical protein AAFV53_10950 [Myxococcota bacterium]